ncbi:hypothetical protein F383_20644 [Gossypium arboreum]|nr:hypothetical protein F383_20644 [Gossypium arboreum]
MCYRVRPHLGRWH